MEGGLVTFEKWLRRRESDSGSQKDPAPAAAHARSLIAGLWRGGRRAFVRLPLWLRAALVPIGAIVLSFVNLALAGRSSVEILATNLPNPLASSRKLLIDIAHPTPEQGPVYRITAAAIQGVARPQAGAHLRVQLASNNRTRILLMRPGSSPSSRLDGLRALLRGEARLKVVADREWLDLGELAPDGSLDVRVVGLLSGPYGFFELAKPAAKPQSLSLQLVRPEALYLTPLKTQPRYRVVLPGTVAWIETLARATFFLRTSTVLQIAGIVALLGLIAGSWALASSRIALAVSLLVPASVTLHAVLLPPLQGADETLHLTTIEEMVAGRARNQAEWVATVVSRVYVALDHDRLQHNADAPVALLTRSQRDIVRAALTSDAAVEDKTKRLPRLGTVPIDARAPLYFRPFALLRSLAPHLHDLDRLSLYRILSVLGFIVPFLAAVALAQKAGLSTGVISLLGLITLFPYLVGTASTTWNYAPAVGLGALLAVCALATILGTPRLRLVGLAVAVAIGTAGAGVWRDFLASVVPIVILGSVWFAKQRRQDVRPLPAWRITIAAVLILAGLAGTAVALRGLSGLSKHDTRLTGGLAKNIAENRAHLGTAVLVLLLPLGLAGVAVGAARWFDRHTQVGLKRRAMLATSAGVVLFAAAFAATSYTNVPYENTRLSFTDYVKAHNASFWSNNFSWDQDRLFWKFYWGAFGWHDCFYPDWVYAFSRWGCVALFLALPILSTHFKSTRRAESDALTIASGLGVSLCVLVGIFRYFWPNNMFGRYLLPYLPLAALPALARIDAPGRERSLRIALWVAVVFHIWTAIYLLGRRYYLSL